MIDVDVATWDDERIRVEIAAILPMGWKFEFGAVNNAYWTAIFTDAEGVVQWEDSFPASNVVLLNAYGWLRLRGTRPTAVWSRRRELTLAEVNADALRRARAESPDPLDVDPSEVLSVYQSKRSK